MKTFKWIVPSLAVVATVLWFSVGSATSAGPGGGHKLDTAHTAVYFRIQHLGMSYTYGRFNDVAGEVVVGGEGHESSFSFTIKAASIDTHNDKRDQHLRSPDFFNAKQYPVITFKSTGAHAHGGKLHVNGDLTLHGVTKPISTMVTKMGEGKDPWGNYRVGYASEFTIKRSDFGMNKMLEAVGDEVELMMSFEVIAD